MNKKEKNEGVGKGIVKTIRIVKNRRKGSTIGQWTDFAFFYSLTVREGV